MPRLATMVDGRFGRLSTFIAMRAGELRGDVLIFLAPLGLFFLAGMLYSKVGPAPGFAVAAIGLASLLWAIGRRLAFFHRRLTDAGRNTLRLDRMRRAGTLFRAFDDEAMLALEEWAADWEAIENSLQSDPWNAHRQLAGRIQRAAARSMEELLFWTGIDGREALATAESWAKRLERLMSATEGALDLMGAYYREELQSNDAPLPEGSPEVANLESALLDVELGILG